MLDIGGKEKGFMKKKTIKYTDESVNARVIKDFLPDPKDLVFKEDNVKVTLSLTKKSINFFKKQSEKFNTRYQTMIRSLLDQYAENFK